MPLIIIEGSGGAADAIAAFIKLVRWNANLPAAEKGTTSVEERLLTNGKRC